MPYSIAPPYPAAIALLLEYSLHSNQTRHYHPSLERFQAYSHYPHPIRFFLSLFLFLFQHPCCLLYYHPHFMELFAH